MQYYAGTITSTFDTYSLANVKEQVERTKSMMNEKKLANGQATNLSQCPSAFCQYLDLYWKHLSQYYQNGKITREQWLQQCNQIKPQTH